MLVILKIKDVIMLIFASKCIYMVHNSKTLINSKIIIHLLFVDQLNQRDYFFIETVFLLRP